MQLTITACIYGNVVICDLFFFCILKNMYLEFPINRFFSHLPMKC